MRNRLHFVWLLMPILELFLLSYRVMPQGITTGSITGTVVDPQGAVISDASIAVTESNTGVVRTTTSPKKVPSLSAMFLLEFITFISRPRVSRRLTLRVFLLSRVVPPT
jgi:hypothetical protein